MNDLQIFDNEEFGSIRTMEEDGQIWFCGKDVATALNYANPKKAITDHCREEGVTIRSLPTNGGIQQAKFINEPNLYRLIIHSKLPSAERFEKWVFEEVLPTLRKTGRYEMPEARQPLRDGLSVQDYMELVKAASSLNDERFRFISEMSQYVNFRPKEKKPMDGKRLFEGIQDVFEFLKDNVKIQNRATADVYSEYVSYCEYYNIQPVPKNIFSKCVRQLTDTEIMVKRINGKPARVFK